MRILLIDIETSPNVADVWGMWQQNVAPSQLRESSRMISFAARWIGEGVSIFYSEFHNGRATMLEAAHELMSEADAIVHYNGNNFDIPILNRELMLAGYDPPAPSKQIDLYRVIKKRFKFPFNKLDYVVQRLGLGQKVEHQGHELWVRCLNNDPEAWEMMKSYNVMDVILLERLYHRLLPWIPTHPNHRVYVEGELCPRCGKRDTLIRRGYAHTLTGKYQRFQCRECRAWSRDGKRVNTVAVQGEAW